MNASGNSFPGFYRVKKSKEFERLKNKSYKLGTKHFLLLVSVSQNTRSRLGITITTKIDKRAVVRNKLKRRIREIFRQHRTSLTKFIDLVVIARRDANNCSYEEMKSEILGTLKSKGYLK